METFFFFFASFLFIAFCNEFAGGWVNWDREEQVFLEGAKKMELNANIFAESDKEIEFAVNCCCRRMQSGKKGSAAEDKR